MRLRARVAAYSLYFEAARPECAAIPRVVVQARDTLSAKEGGESFVSGRHVRGSSRHYRRSLAHRVLLRLLRVQPRLNGVDDRLRLLRRLAPSLPATFVVHELAWMRW